MTDFVAITCWRCNEVYGLSRPTYETVKRSGAGFSCPWGHEAAFTLGPTEADKLRLERDRLKQRTTQLEDEVGQAQVEIETERRRAAAARGQVTKIKKRVSNGVCPCCNRTFADLQRHMAAKHAGFVAEEVEAQVGRALNAAIVEGSPA